MILDHLCVSLQAPTPSAHEVRQSFSDSMRNVPCATDGAS